MLVNNNRDNLGLTKKDDSISRALNKLNSALSGSDFSTVLRPPDGNFKNVLSEFELGDPNSELLERGDDFAWIDVSRASTDGDYFTTKTLQ